MGGAGPDQSAGGPNSRRPLMRTQNGVVGVVMSMVEDGETDGGGGGCSWKASSGDDQTCWSGAIALLLQSAFVVCNETSANKMVEGLLFEQSDRVNLLRTYQCQRAERVHQTVGVRLQRTHRCR